MCCGQWPVECFVMDPKIAAHDYKACFQHSCHSWYVQDFLRPSCLSKIFELVPLLWTFSSVLVPSPLLTMPSKMTCEVRLALITLEHQCSNSDCKGPSVVALTPFENDLFSKRIGSVLGQSNPDGYPANGFLKRLDEPPIQKTKTNVGSFSTVTIRNTATNG